MPKVSGQDIISSTTERSFRTLILVSSAAALTKAYDVPLDQLSILGAELPRSLLDVTLLVAVTSLLYAYIVKWFGDMVAFRLWYRDSSIWSEFGTNMKLDKNFINGGVRLLHDLHFQKSAGTVTHDQLPMETIERLQEFENNVELYASRLEAAGTKFATLSFFGHFYVWVQHFVFPVGIAGFAIYLLLKFGTFLPPVHL